MEKKLVIQPQRYSGETTVTSMRVPKEMLNEIDAIARDTGRTRNEILMLAIEFALDNLVISEK